MAIDDSFGFRSLLFGNTGQTQQMEESSMPDMPMKDMFVHPFLAHMSLPDRVGEVSCRFTGYRTRMDGMTRSDFAVHIETALFKRLGLHLRADGIRYEDFSDIMLQYTVIADEGSNRGLAVYGELNVPTGMVNSEQYKGSSRSFSPSNRPQFHGAGR